MSNSKISALTSATTPVDGTEVLPIVQSSATTQVTIANLTAGRSVSGANFVVTSSTIPANGVYLPAANSVGIATNTTLRATVDASGNLGIGVTPSAWNSNYKAIQLGSGGSVSAHTSTALPWIILSSNNYIDNVSGGTSRYIQNGYAPRYLIRGDDGSHVFYTSPSGTAGGAITFTQSMTLNTSGSLGIGVASAATKLDVLGTIQATVAATQDAVRLAGRAGGTGTFAATITPTTLTASRTLTLPDATTTVVGTDATQTLTNKWVQPRVLASTANSATPTLNTDNYDMMVITGQTLAITSFTTNLTGTPVNGQKLLISITGTAAVGITWGASFEASTTALPTTTVTTNRLDVGFIWNVATTKWRCLAVA
jgi:hypothetical protein